MKSKKIKTKLLWLLPFSFIALLALVGCNHNTSTDSGVEPAPAPVDKTVTFSDLNWNSALIQNRIAGYIAQEGYGYTVDYIPGNTISLFQALQNNDTDVTMEIWYANQKEAWDKASADGDVVKIGNTIEDNWQSAFVIPKYTADKYPNLKSVEDLKKPEFIEVFSSIETGDKARLLTCPAGWECEKVNEEQFKAYNLGEHVELVSPGSGEALFADLEGAFKRQEDWLGYMWSPTKITGKYDLVRLEEPAYTEECWNADKACGYPASPIYIAAHSSFVERSGDLVSVLEKFNLTSADVAEAEAWMEDNNKEPNDAAIWFLQNNNKWERFVTQSALNKIEGSLDKYESLVEPAPVDKTVTFSDLNWNSALIQNRIAGYIAQEGYGYTVDYIPGNTISLFQALQNNDTDVTMEIWYANQKEAWDKASADGDVVKIGNTIEDNWQSAFVIPKYTADKYPNLKSVEDLKKPEFTEVFSSIETGDKARLVTCPPGWECEKVNEEQFNAYNLGEYVELVSPGSGEALFADLEGAVKREEAWLGYIWSPTKITGKYDLVRLEEPAYTEECWSADKACGYPASPIYIAAHSSFVERADDLVSVLEKFNLTSADVAEAEAWMEDNNKEPNDAAIWFLQNNNKWERFVTQSALDKIESSLSS